jgi:hypothetical protein
MTSTTSAPESPVGMKRFRQAVEARDLAEMTQSLAVDVVFESPIVFKRHVGRETVGFILGAVMTVFEDFRYVSELDGEGETALVFKARVGDKELHGIDLGEVDAEGAITKLTVFVRPLSAALALRDAMGARLGTTG